MTYVDRHRFLLLHSGSCCCTHVLLVLVVALRYDWFLLLHSGMTGSSCCTHVLLVLVVALVLLLHRPSNKGTKLLLKVIKAIIIITHVLLVLVVALVLLHSCYHRFCVCLHYHREERGDKGIISSASSAHF